MTKKALVRLWSGEISTSWRKEKEKKLGDISDRSSLSEEGASVGTDSENKQGKISVRSIPWYSIR